MYYQKIVESTKATEIAFFVEYMLEAIKTAVTEMLTDYETDYETDYVGRLLKALGNQELSTPQIMRKLGLSGVSNFRKVYLNPALEKGLIERTIPEKPKSKHQKYRRSSGDGQAPPA